MKKLLLAATLGSLFAFSGAAIAGVVYQAGQEPDVTGVVTAAENLPDAGTITIGNVTITTPVNSSWYQMHWKLDGAVGPLATGMIGKTCVVTHPQRITDVNCTSSGNSNSGTASSTSTSTSGSASATSSSGSTGLAFPSAGSSSSTTSANPSPWPMALMAATLYVAVDDTNYKSYVVSSATLNGSAVKTDSAGLFSLYGKYCTWSAGIGNVFGPSMACSSTASPASSSTQITGAPPGNSGKVGAVKIALFPAVNYDPVLGGFKYLTVNGLPVSTTALATSTFGVRCTNGGSTFTAVCTR